MVTRLSNLPSDELGSSQHLRQTLSDDVASRVQLTVQPLKRRQSVWLQKWSNIACVALFWLVVLPHRASASDDNPKFMQEVAAYWWSSTPRSLEEFELPSSVRTCSILRVRFIGKVAEMMSERQGDFPYGGTILIEDSASGDLYTIGSKVNVSMYNRYNDIEFWNSTQERNSMGLFFLDKKDPSVVIRMVAGALQPQEAVSYVCAFKWRGYVTLSYFIDRISPLYPYR